LDYVLDAPSRLAAEVAQPRSGVRA